MPATASIVVATYNRPQVLDYAIRSVLQSTFEDWELIVVGDGCTDETEELVRSYGDARISWHNLPENTGNQAAPNNAGVARARGRYVCFLNHDDMWFADHLGASIASLERTGADMVFSPVALLQRSGRDSGPPDPRVDVIGLDGMAPRGYDPRVFVIASSWAIRRDAYDRVGPWRAPATTRLSPSQEWLHRAARKKLSIVYEPRISVLCIHAGVRRLSYLRPSPEHARAWTWVRDAARPDADLLEAIAIHTATAAEAERASALPAKGLGGRIRAGVVDVAERLGAHPHAVERRLRREGKGAWIAGVHRFTFDASVLPPDVGVTVTAEDGAEYLVSGWHPPESWGVWSAEPSAVVGFELEGGVREPVLEITGAPFRPQTEAVFRVDGRDVVRHAFRSPRETVAVALGDGESRVVFVEVEVDELASPNDLGESEDRRTLGFGLAGLRLVSSA